MTLGKDPCTHQLATEMLSERSAFEARFIELLSIERDHVARPSGHLLAQRSNHQTNSIHHG